MGDALHALIQKAAVLDVDVFIHLVSSSRQFFNAEFNSLLSTISNSSFRTAYDLLQPLQEVSFNSIGKSGLWRYADFLQSQYLPRPGKPLLGLFSMYSVSRNHLMSSRKMPDMS